MVDDQSQFNEHVIDDDHENQNKKVIEKVSTAGKKIKIFFVLSKLKTGICNLSMMYTFATSHKHIAGDR